MAGRIEWRTYWRSRPVRRDTVLYESQAGSGVEGNPEAIFRALLDDPGRQHLRHVWVLDDSQRQRECLAELAAHPRVRFVRRGSLAYHRHLATAGYLFNNLTFPAQFSKRAGQVYVNTWHGTPLTRMGYDAHDRVGTRNILRNLAGADYVLSASPFMTEHLYESAFRLRNIFEGQVIEEGTPRTDLQRRSSDPAAGVRRQLRTAGLRVAYHERLILYAPIWRGDSFASPEATLAMLEQRVREIQAHLPAGDRVLLKVHHQVHRGTRPEDSVRDVLVPDHLSGNRLLSDVDVLLTDYSSICFDFLSTGRPILFFAPDLDQYARDRGFYLPTAEWPGPVTRSTREVAEAIRALGSGAPDDPVLSHAQAYKAAGRRLAPHDDGQVSRRVVDIVFGPGGTAGHRVRRLARAQRPKILMNLGGLRSNGITSSALNLLRLLDPAKADVSVFYHHDHSEEQARIARQLPSSVRVIPSVGSMTIRRRDRGQRTRLLRGGLDAPGLDSATLQQMFSSEWRRCFGDIRFDHIIDYSGYAPVWTYLLLQGPARSHSIWLHSDMVSDQGRDVRGNQPHAQNLRAVISMYNSFDRLVSVSQTLSEVNLVRLRGSADPEKFTWVPNVIDAERVERLATESPGVGPAGSAESPTFVSVGRLSPEKNHARLIHAFRRVHADHPTARLQIVGDGPLRQELTTLVHELELDGSVQFTGRMANPYPLMRAAVALVVTSEYEGHSVVTLEARVLGTPVVSTAYPSVRGVLPEGAGLVVPLSTDGVADGMRHALAAEVPHPPFDIDRHNAEALDRFLAVVCGGT